MSFNPDPFTQIERALWHVLESHSPFTDLVKPGNRIKFAHTDTGRDPIKDELQTADMPEVMILPTTTAGKNRSSKGPGITQSFNLVITTGDTRTWVKLYPVKWEVYRAFEKLNDQIKHLCPFVTQVNVGGFSDGFNVGEQRERGPRGWNSVLDIGVDSIFSHAEIAE